MELFDLNLLVKVIGKSMGIRVEMGNHVSIRKDESGTLVTTIPPLKDGTEDDLILLRSHLCHEVVGHGRFTDFEAPRGPTNLHRTLENVLEDARIEKASWGVYKKARKILDEGLSILIKENGIRRARKEQSPAEAVATAVLIRLMIDELGYCQGEIDWTDDWSFAVNLFGDDTMNKVWAEAVFGYQTGSTVDVIKSAARIVELLKQEPPKDEPKSQGQGQGQSEGEQSSKRGRGVNLNLDKVNPNDFDRGDSFISRVRVDWIDPLSKDMPTLDFTKEEPVNQLDVKEMSLSRRKLSNALERRLRTIVDDEDDGLNDCGSLSGNKIIDAVMGERYVFNEPGEAGEGVDTAVSILLDQSGSMRRGETLTRGESCVMAAKLIGDVFNKFPDSGLKFSLSSFNSSLYLLKGWDTKWRNGALLAHYKPSGSTLTVKAAQNRLSDLAQRKERRKILMIITDGALGEIRPVINSAYKLGIEVPVLMINDDEYDREIAASSYQFIKRFENFISGDLETSIVKSVSKLFD